MKQCFDVAVLGGGVAGVFSALTLANKGKSVVLITDKAFFLDEFTASIRPWLNGKQTPSPFSFSGKIFKNPTMQGDDLTVYKNADLKRHTFALLEECNISLVIDHQVCGLAGDGENACGVVLASKFGIEIVYANNIIDARVNQESTWYTMQLTRVLPFKSGNIEISDAQLKAYAVWGGEDNTSFVTFCAHSHKDAAFVAEKLLDSIKSIDAFSQANAYYSGYGLTAANQNSFLPDCKYANVHKIECEISMDVCARQLEDAEKFVEQSLGTVRWKSGGFDMEFIDVGKKIPACELSFLPSDDINAEFRMDRIEFDYEKYLPLYGSYDVAVVGGGSGGAAAASAAGRNCDSVVMIDRLPSAGGTQSYGLVYSYYHGYQSGYAALTSYHAISKLGGLSPLKRMIQFSIDIHQNNVDVISKAWACGAVAYDGRAQGVVFCHNSKLSVIRAKVMVDATGDGDYAAFAGAEYVLGSDYDGMLQDSSQWEIGGYTKDIDVVNQTIYSDYLRAVKLAHYKEGAYDYSVMLTPREGRRFNCDYNLSMRDVILGAHHDDCIALAQTDCDPHGVMSSQLSMMGLTPYHDEVFRIEVPYRSCIPKGIEGILLAGKAVGATQDASAYLRMGADIQNRGYAIGLLAADAAARNVSVRQADVCGTQKVLLNMQIINKENLSGIKRNIDTDDIIKKALSGDMKSFAKLLCLDREDVIDQLEHIYSKDQDILTAVALGWFQSASPLPLLVQRLWQLADNPKNLSYSDDHPWKEQNNKGGIMYNDYEPYWEANQIITVLGILGDKSALPAVRKVIEHTTSGGRPREDNTSVFKGRIDLKKIPHSDRIRVLDFAVRSLADEGLCMAIESLMDKNHLHGYITFKDNYLDSGLNSQPVYTELMVARMAARCKSKKGREKLQTLTKDVHYIIAKNAADELSGSAYKRNNTRF